MVAIKWFGAGGGSADDGRRAADDYTLFGWPVPESIRIPWQRRSPCRCAQFACSSGGRTRVSMPVNAHNTGTNTHTLTHNAHTLHTIANGPRSFRTSAVRRGVLPIWSRLLKSQPAPANRGAMNVRRNAQCSHANDRFERGYGECCWPGRRR